jgi:dTDP-4-amino-4,6-dideoxygalactose transaminase
MSDYKLISHCDLRSQVAVLREEIVEAVERVVQSGWYILGKEVEEFEKEFSGFIGMSNPSVGVANGTDAICIALQACGLRPGDGVITVSHTAVATVAAIEQGGFVPVLADIDLRTYTLCPSSFEECIALARRNGINLKAVVPVHLYGHPVGVSELLELANREGLVVIEDCSQAHGAKYRGAHVGTFGTAAAWSLYPTKNLGALGDGGLLYSNYTSVVEKAKLLRQYGWEKRNWSEIPGRNSRLDEIQAAILRVKLRRLEQFQESRRHIASTYTANLAEFGICPFVQENVEHAWHQYVIRTDRRDQLMVKLSEFGIASMIHYPYPVHQQPAYKNRVLTASRMDNTELASRTILSLPMYPELPFDDLFRVIGVVRKFFSASY